MIGDFYANPQFAVDGYWDSKGTPDTADDAWVDGDYHLKSEGGRWTPMGWVIDSITSHCIDAGNPADSVGEEPTPNGNRINIGNYGGTAWASKTPDGTGEPITFPGMVENLVVHGGHKQIILQWDVPNDDGGLEIETYKIYRGINEDELDYYRQVSGVENVFIDIEIDNNTNYFYSISAVNGFGEGELVTPVRITTDWNEKDLNGDGIIDLVDFSLFCQEWLWEADWYQP